MSTGKENETRSQHRARDRSSKGPQERAGKGELRETGEHTEGRKARATERALGGATRQEEQEKQRELEERHEKQNGVQTPHEGAR